MSVFSHQIDLPVLEKQESKPDQKQKVDQEKLKSKLKGLNEHLKCILQKKIRLDLEIKSTKKKVKQLQQLARTEIHARVVAEGFNPEEMTPEAQTKLLQEATAGSFTETYSLDEQIYLSEFLLEQAETLPLYTGKEIQ